MKVLFLTMGPPAEKPNWLRLYGGRGLSGASKKFLASKTSFRRNPKTVPWISFVPDFMTTLTTPPADLPYSAEKEFVSTLNSWTASIEIAVASDLRAWVALCRLLLSMPSSITLFWLGRMPEALKESLRPVSVIMAPVESSASLM